MTNFFDSMRNSQLSRTENGALGYATSGKRLVDLNFKTSSLRGASDTEILGAFYDAYAEDPVLALRWLFYARDIRGGMGERNIFRVVLNDLVKNGKVSVGEDLYNLVGEYGRYDDYINLLDLDLTYRQESTILHTIYRKFGTDVRKAGAGEPVSLLGKWMPSINTSSAKTKARARKIAKACGMPHRVYRKYLKGLREAIGVVEQTISAQDWGEVNYEHVPSQANLKYSDAFLRHDEWRRRAFLNSLSRGEVKVNASAVNPCEIVHKYGDGRGWSTRLKAEDALLEGMWKNLPEKEISNTLVVADGSGSMTVSVGNSSMRALDVANSLAIYFAEHNKGEFYNKYITFSERPQFVDFGVGARSLHDKLQIALTHNECANTNIEAVFDLILKTAVRNHLSQYEMPERILIVSDMEFDQARGYGFWNRETRDDETLFANIASKYTRAGYKLPKLVFWNVNSRTGTLPVQENENGVALISGYSVNVAEMVMSDKLDPFEILKDTLERYSKVDHLAIK